jgi:ElaB/YqjD/DUF883 family membrane-anchored ribosome-binding protein
VKLEGAKDLEKQLNGQTIKPMSTHTNSHSHDIVSLAEDARALMVATVGVTGEKVGQARKRLTVALKSAKEMVGNARDKAITKAKAADEAVHENPYKAMAIVLGVGTFIGYAVARRGCDKKN